MEVKLVVQSGKQAGTVIPVKGDRLLIGRGEECQLRPQSSLVSRKHCLIVVGEGSATIEDCGSTNGTFLNDRRITERCELHNGDRLRVGMLGLEFQLSVGVVGHKKPKVISVKEAAARTAGSSPSLQEDLDISGWLEDDGLPTDSPTRREPLQSGDTVAGKSLLDTSTLPVAPPNEKKDEEKEDEGKETKIHPPKKAVGKFHAPAKPKTETSGEAAADVLRQFFHRKKP